MPHLLCFTNCQICVAGELIPQDVYFSPDQAIIVPNYYYRTEGVERIDLGGAVVAPGFLELQTNGLQGLHFTQLGGKDDEEKLLQVARSQVRCGVTGFWGTVPTVEEGSWKKVRFAFPLSTQHPWACLAFCVGDATTENGAATSHNSK
jgi:N-acetylglucosamine-6-phosphate deacetylase